MRAWDLLYLPARGSEDELEFIKRLFLAFREPDCSSLIKAVEAGSAGYLKRVAVEIRQPASIILQRIAPQLPGVPVKQPSAG